jgi:ABC-2 type transport system ATP-binding protein
MSISTHDLSYRYGSRQALDGISFEVGAGTVAALLGSNGAGKSTLFKVLCGLLNPMCGTVKVNGFTLPKARQSIGYVAQHFGLYEDLTVEQNIRFFAAAYGMDGASVTSRTAELMERFELAPRRKDRAGALSQGWKQRLAFASSLAHRPAVLLLDEVTAGLDPTARQYVWEMIRAEADRGVTVLLSTHHMDEAERCDSSIWLKEGKLQ